MRKNVYVKKKTGRENIQKYIDNKCRRYISVISYIRKGIYINPAIDLRAKERTLAGKIPI